jgi:hypothetical protein
MSTTIEKAGYGVYDSTIDVTHHVTKAYEDGERVFKASDKWGDPAPGQRKYLYIFWNHNGESRSGVIGEDDSRGITLP